MIIYIQYVGVYVKEIHIALPVRFSLVYYINHNL